jgi:dihydroflavonol-4-reductase
VEGGNRITFPTYVPDVVQGVMLALENGRFGHTYHICSQSLDHNSVNSVVSDLAGIGRWRINMPRWAVLALAKSWTAVSRLTHREPFYPINMAPYVFQDWRISTAKAESELGFRPTPFRIGAQATLDWYRQSGILRQR